MGYLDQCKACDRGEHDKCDGTVTIFEQDGPNAYVCRCYHRRDILEAQRVAQAEADVRRLMSELRISRTHELVVRDSGGNG